MKLTTKTMACAATVSLFAISSLAQSPNTNSWRTNIAEFAEALVQTIKEARDPRSQFTGAVTWRSKVLDLKDLDFTVTVSLPPPRDLPDHISFPDHVSLSLAASSYIPKRGDVVDFSGTLKDDAPEFAQRLGFGAPIVILTGAGNNKGKVLIIGVNVKNVEIKSTTTNLAGPSDTARNGNPRPIPSSRTSNLPKYQEEVRGTTEVRVKNPNDFSVMVGLRSEGRGRDFSVPAKDSKSVYVPDGRYDIFFQYSSDPDGLYQGDSFTLKENGVEIQIVKVVNGNYGIRKVK
jgi:hypothetical protein